MNEYNEMQHNMVFTSCCGSDT